MVCGVGSALCDGIIPSVGICRGGSLEYRHGFNGQEKSPEISNGHTTALFWEYDSRIAKRWNVDPRPVVSISPYAVMQGNPILFSDPLGDTAILTSALKKDGTPYYSVEELKKIVEYSKAIDKQNGITSLGYKVVDARDLVNGKAEIDALDDVLYFVSPGPDGHLTWDSYIDYIDGAGKIPGNLVGGHIGVGYIKNALFHSLLQKFTPDQILMNIAGAFNHEVNVHAYKMLFISIYGGNQRYNGNDDHDTYNGGLGNVGKSDGYLKLSQLKYSQWSKDFINKWNGRFLQFRTEYRTKIRPLIYHPLTPTMNTLPNKGLYPVKYLILVRGKNYRKR